MRYIVSIICINIYIYIDKFEGFLKWEYPKTIATIGFDTQMVELLG